MRNALIISLHNTCDILKSDVQSKSIENSDIYMNNILVIVLNRDRF